MLKNRVILCGDMKTGKTSIARAMRSLDFQDLYQSTLVSCYFSFSSKSNDGNEFQINVWDVGGDPSIRNIAEIYLCNIDVAVIVIDENSTIEGICYWIGLIQHKNVDFNAKIIIAVNKIDQTNIERKIDESKIKDFACKNGCKIAFTSTKNGNGINELKEMITNELITIHEENLMKVRQYAYELEKEDNTTTTNQQTVYSDEDTCCILE